jgi:predicted transposase YbfD/YdcC
MPKKTVRAITKSKCHYVIKVKANQKKLFNQMQSTCSLKPEESYSTLEFQKGRQEHRKIEVFTANEEQKDKWSELNTFLKVTRWGVRNGESYKRTGYYISDLRLKAKEFLIGIRQHWTIENCLHWVKDVIFKEDKCRARSANSPANLSLIRSFVITVLSKTGKEINEIMNLVTNKPEIIVNLLE